MKRRSFFQNSLTALAGFSSLANPFRSLGDAGGAQAADRSLKSHWPVRTAHLFHSALEDGLGFSFTYDGQKVGPDFPKDWDYSTTLNRGIAVTILQHSTGLLVTREARAFPESDAVEYTVRFKNGSSSVLPTLGPVVAMDLRFQGEEELQGLSVVSSGGGGDSSNYPPPDYAIHRRSFAPMVPGYGAITLTTVGGRSSSLDLPFWFIENQQANSGIFLAFGWSGQWRATMAGGFPKPTLSVTGEIPNISVRLRPGEEISGPHVLMGSYEGPLSSGSNQIRRLLRSQYTPLLGKEKPQPICVYDHWWNIGGDFDEKLLRQLADAAADLGQEAFLLDAEWSIDTPGHVADDFGVGNWVPNKSKFPSGIRAFADYVRSKGLRFGLWFEPERVVRGSILAREHPDWVIWLPRSEYGLLNLALPEAEQWARELLDRYIRELEIQYLRYDFNIEPLGYWATADAPDRRGMTQIRHIEAFYRIIDWIRDRYPETEMEGCASGGRRIDLETVRRFHSFWISDHTVDPNIIRFHFHGLSHFLTGNYLYGCYTLPLPGEKGFNSPDIAFQSLFGGEFGTGGRIHEWPQSMKEQARRHVAVYKQIRKYLQRDYYTLTGQPLNMDSWEARQFHDPTTQEGFVQAFRLKSEKSSEIFRLGGLNPNRTYRLSDPYSGKSRSVEASELMINGIRFELGPMSSGICIYQEATRPSHL